MVTRNPNRLQSIVESMGHKYLPASGDKLVPTVYYDDTVTRGHAILYDNDTRRTIQARIEYFARDYAFWLKEQKR